MLKPVLVVLTLAQGGGATHVALTSAETTGDCAVKAQAVRRVLEGAGHSVLAARCAETDLEFTPYGQSGDKAERPHAWRVTLPETGAVIEPLAEGAGCTPAPDSTPAVHCAWSAQGVIK